MEFVKKIGSKVIFVYLLMMVVTIVFSIVMIFENQTDLISENTKIKIELKVDGIISSLERFARNVNGNPIFPADSKKDLIEQVIAIIVPVEKRFLLINDKDEIQTASSDSVTIPEDYKDNKLKALTNYQFAGEKYYLSVDPENMAMHFYIPLGIKNLDNYILILTHDLHEMKQAEMVLYRQSLFIILVIVIINIVFAVTHYRMVVRPLKSLHRVSQAIAQGNLKARSDITTRDEFGDLSRSINVMARSLEERFEHISDERDEVMKEKEKIEIIANRDELTGLYNRRYLFGCIENEISNSRHKKGGVGFLMLDIDHFKKFNDTYGHQIGDKVLQVVAEELQKQCRKQDVVGRYGGEEFAVLLPDADEKILKMVGERIRENIEKTRIDTGTNVVNVTASIGGTILENAFITSAKSCEKSYNKIMNLMIYYADSALYLAKDRGRNRFELG
ncbi:MAG: GGDEF domain-containing protein [Spirochaetia bacterium]|nr:GGDEF domain-containing protein [Spirochaetia bacterium]